MTTLDRLLRTKDLLGENGEGWIQYSFYDRMSNRRCLLGAYMKAGELVQDKVGLEILHNIVQGRGFSNIAHFNDFISTRWSDVEEVLNKAIEEAQNEHV